MNNNYKTNDNNSYNNDINNNCNNDSNNSTYIFSAELKCLESVVSS